MFFKQFAKFLKYFGKGYKWTLTKILSLAFISAFLDFLSVAIVFPLVIMIMDPGNFTHSIYYKFLSKYINMPTDRNLLLILGGIFVAIILGKNLYMIFNLYWQNKIIKKWALDVNEKLMQYFLFAPYQENVKQSNSERIFDITRTVNTVFEYFVFKVIIFVSNIIVVAVIFSILVYLLPLFTTFAIIFFIISAIAQNYFFRKWSKNLADEKYKLTTGPFEALISSLKCIKEIKITGSENYFYGIYKNIAEKMIPLMEKLNLIPIIPQYIIEVIFILTIVILSIGIFIQYNGNPTGIMALFIIVAISIYRMAPLIYKSQVCLNYINIYKDYVYKMTDIVDQYKKYDNLMSYHTDEKLNFQNNIKLENIKYSYDNEITVLEDISLEIKKGEFVGIIGLSGSGKTTLVDIMMGLLLPQQGEVIIDNRPLNAENTRKFQNIIGYVSQNINTFGGSVAENIAWGIDPKEIDPEKITQALKTAQLYDQLMKMPDGIHTRLNPDGSGLSQGQRQRIGIARALYREPDILILDEATSSLDVVVENDLTEIFNKIKGNKTIIAIAHRFSTLKNCDKIVYLNEGRLVDVGTFAELSNKHPDFEEIIKLSKIQLLEEKDEEYEKLKTVKPIDNMSEKPLDYDV